ncbi:NCS1 family nucleobase:cation symporter-1 [Mycobacterium frederiksbergense]|uniref:NCS1 family nucleobase:cation symporter-1 n=1 Tax=Mycolicibacterium frederiksbergense TaxID=117567 RepID=A0ABT6KTD1_9MYCO|nr:cytosine permease [Mycolicibacterium frederiksbergense]MDH6193971.1 NCS1 family nucleobase:cation symporter-1 [Mycolicibacterium frederiksbergense]
MSEDRTGSPVDRGERHADPPSIETHSIDYIPLRERRGKPWHQGPFWFMGQFTLTTALTGFIGPSLGLALGWSVLAIVLGILFATFFMAFHANQGPRLGLPQMIQSRAQFGHRGVVVPFIATLFVYVGFNAFNAILMVETLDLLIPGDALPIGKTFWYIVVLALPVLMAIAGYDLLHLFERWIFPLSVVVFGVLMVGAIVTLDAGSATPDAGFSAVPFLIQFGAVAGYQISYAVYVSDYSRYLPRDTSAPALIAWTYLGAAASAILMMSFGSLLASSLREPDAIGSARMVGDNVFDGFGTIVLIISFITLLGPMAINTYGGMLTLLSAVDGFRPVRPGIRVRVIGIVIVALVVLVLAVSLPADLLTSFNNWLLLMLYFLVPWTAVNLVDFYLVRRGHYAVMDIFRAEGIYGRWSVPGLVAYLAGLLAMVPFANVSFFQGPIARLIGGADVSFVIGLAVAAVVYYAFMFRVDLDHEQQAIADSELLLEGDGSTPRTISPTPKG